MPDNFSLQNIANGENLPDNISIDNAKNQLKIFFIASAKKELQRVIKLTNTLDKLEEVYQQRALEYIEENDNDEITLMVIPNMIQTISLCLARANNIIQKVITDEKLLNFLVINDLNITNTVNNAVISLQEPEARNRVREAITTIINNIDNIDNIDNINENNEGTINPNNNEGDNNG